LSRENATSVSEKHQQGIESGMAHECKEGNGPETARMDWGCIPSVKRVASYSEEVV